MDASDKPKTPPRSRRRRKFSAKNEEDLIAEGLPPQDTAADAVVVVHRPAPPPPPSEATGTVSADSSTLSPQSADATAAVTKREKKSKGGKNRLSWLLRKKGSPKASAKGIGGNNDRHSGEQDDRRTSSVSSTSSISSTGKTPTPSSPLPGEGPPNNSSVTMLGAATKNVAIIERLQRDRQRQQSKDAQYSVAYEPQPIDCNPIIPLGIRACIQFLETPDALSEQGLFRVSGNAVTIQKHFQSFRAGDANALRGELDPNNVCGLLKLLLKETGLPLDSKSAKRMAKALDGATDDEKKIKRMRKVLAVLEEEQLATYQALLMLFRKVISYPGTVMRVGNLSTSIGPTLYPSLSAQKCTPVLGFTMKHIDECFDTEALDSVRQKLDGDTIAPESNRVSGDGQLSYSHVHALEVTEQHLTALAVAEPRGSSSPQQQQQQQQAASPSSILRF